MRTQFNLRNEQIHSLLDNQLNGRPHMIHITRKKAMIEIRVFKEGAKTRHISFKEIKNKSIITIDFAELISASRLLSKRSSLLKLWAVG